MSKLRKKIIILVTLLLLSQCVMAHSGGTDSKGGHYDHSTGEYHYHHGEREHQHYGDMCEIEIEEQNTRERRKAITNIILCSAGGLMVVGTAGSLIYLKRFKQ